MSEDKNLEAKIRLLEEANNHLAQECRSIYRKYMVAQSMLDRSRLHSASKDNLLNRVTEEKSRQEKFFSLLLQQSPNIILFLDQRLRFVYCSNPFLSHLGISHPGMLVDR